MSGKRSRRKGAAGERELANILKERLGLDVHRGLQTAGARVCDVEGCPVWIEVKRGKKVSIRKGYEQARNDTDGRVPVLVYRDDRCEWMVLASLADVLDAIEEHLEMGEE